MERLFNDFDICTSSTISLQLYLNKEGQVKGDTVLEENIAIYLTHKESGNAFSVSSNDDSEVLKELSEGYKECDYDIDLFMEKFSEED